MVRNNIYLCNVKTKKKMIQNFTYILLCGIIIHWQSLVEVSAVREYICKMQ